MGSPPTSSDSAFRSEVPSISNNGGNIVRHTIAFCLLGLKQEVFTSSAEGTGSVARDARHVLHRYCCEPAAAAATSTPLFIPSATTCLHTPQETHTCSTAEPDIRWGHGKSISLQASSTTRYIIVTGRASAKEQLSKQATVKQLLLGNSYTDTLH
jgi:hypothetical protein